MLLSAIGPSAYESAQSQDHKDSRRSPVHPAGLPGDNVSYELAVANGKKSPVKRGSQPGVENTQNGGYPIPVTDYEGKNFNMPRGVSVYNAEKPQR